MSDVSFKIGAALVKQAAGPYGSKLKNNYDPGDGTPASGAEPTVIPRVSGGKVVKTESTNPNDMEAAKAARQKRWREAVARRNKEKARVSRAQAKSKGRRRPQTQVRRKRRPNPVVRTNTGVLRGPMVFGR